MEDEEKIGLRNEDSQEKISPEGCCPLFQAPINWFRKLAQEMHWSFVFGVVVVYGVSQGMGGGLSRVASDYYWKDVQKVQPSETQFYMGITSIPWIIKPLWGLLTDVVPVAGYKRRPYFALAGLIGGISMLILSLNSNLHVVVAILCLTTGSAGVAIADVTIDACVAQNSINHPALAGDLQSLCGLSSSIGALIGFSVSGVLAHLIGSQGVLGLLSVPAALVFLVGAILNEPCRQNFAYREVHQKLLGAGQSMWVTLKCPDIWRPCLYMYISFALSLNIQEGMFYWYTDNKAGPAFSQENIGFIFSIGSVGSLLGVLLYQNVLKDYPFHVLLFGSQLLLGISGMMDLVLVLRLNLKCGMPDSLFVVFDEIAYRMVGQLKWMPLLVLSSKLCPPGIEGTFFALLMSIDNFGLLTSSWLGSLLLHILKVTRTEFNNLWLAILVRNIMRILPLSVLFLVPKGDLQSTILPLDLLNGKEEQEIREKDDNIEMVALVDNTR
ncbi:probable folate-biopterin transporter 2 [Aristolochia californica]|uniref:probable folate-biopterin transporter 2 n=1 Tax=Aristolochia californica TaxID=171875 RepID=UPI0035E07824